MKKFTILFAMAILTITAFSQFTEDFEDGIAATRWTVVEEGTSNTYNLAFDYVAAGLAAAPNGGGLGMKIIVNETAGESSQVLAFPTDQTFTGEYTVSFDCWMNWVGTEGTTEFALFGVQHTDELVPNNTGLELAITGDGGSGSDVRLYVEGVGVEVDATVDPDTTKFYLAGTRNFTHEPYTLLGEYAGMQWLEVDIMVTADSAFFYVNDALWVRHPALTDGNIMLGYADWFTSLAADGENWIVYDNLVVEPAGTSVSDLNGNIETFRMFPNPANDVLNIVVNSRSTVELVNTVGQIVQRSTVEGGASTLDISGLNPGMYFVKVGADIQKVMVK
jgi:Secretion system C-terminal sorting domain